MKKVVRILGLCALVALATVSCKKDDNNVPQGGKSFRATINQPTDGAKTHIGDGNYLMWNSGDAIKVYTADGTSARFTTTADNVYENAEFTGDIKEADKYIAFYPNDNASDAQDGFVTLTLPDQQTYAENNFANGAYPMAAYWEGTAGDDVDFQFHSPCAVVCLPLKGNVKVTSIDLTGKNYTDVLAGTLKVDINNFDPANPSAGGYQPASAEWTVSLSCGNGVQLDPNTPTNFYFVVAAPHTIFKKGLKFDVNYEGGNETLETSQDNSLSAETILTMPAAEVNEPVFSVANNRKVLFSQGNLYHSTDGFHFEEKQTDFTEWDIDHQSYFVWSRNAETALAQNWGAVESGIQTTDVFFTNATAITPNSSFAVDNVAGIWRTLSRDEWDYLLGSRSGLRYARATVNDVHGLLLFPDGYALPTGYTTDGGTGMSKVNFADVSTYPSENIPAETWTSMESAGVVFLPAAGDYDYYDYNIPGFGAGSSFKGMEYVGVAGKYWASDGNATDLFKSEAAVFAEDDHNVGHYLVTGITVHRYDHQCIRLVRTL